MVAWDWFDGRRWCHGSDYDSLFLWEDQKESMYAAIRMHSTNRINGTTFSIHTHRIFSVFDGVECDLPL